MKGATLIVEYVDGGWVPSFVAEGLGLGEAAEAIRIMKQCLLDTQKHVIGNLPPDLAQDFLEVVERPQTVEVESGIMDLRKRS